MFFDWLAVYQDHDVELPVISDKFSIWVDAASGDCLHSSQPSVKHTGSYSTSILIRVSGRRVVVSGNPSRFNRSENLFGLPSIESCIAVYNSILAKYNLPPFTKNTGGFVKNDYHGIETMRPNGAVITEIHLTSNVATGADNTPDFIRGLSTLPFRNSVPRLHTNGNTVDWVSKSGKAGSLIYPSVYIKGRELALHALPKVVKEFGQDSGEFRYLQKVIAYCTANGVARFELKLKSAYLRREGLNRYGLIDIEKLRAIHSEFTALPKKLKVESMTFENIAQELLRTGVCKSTLAANTTCLYAVQWMHGQQFDLKKSQVKTHRARLRAIGLDIALPYDMTKHSLVRVKFNESRAIEISPLKQPSWYRRASHLSIAA